MKFPPAELPTPTVFVWPPGSEIYSGESVFLQCSVESNSAHTWTYQWYRNTSSTLSTSNYRHSVSGDSYSITAVKREDAGSYWCKAKHSESNFTTDVQVVLNVSGEQQQQRQPLQHDIRIPIYAQN